MSPSKRREHAAKEFFGHIGRPKDADENASVSESETVTDNASENASVNTSDTASVTESITTSKDVSESKPGSTLGNIDVDAIISNKRNAQPKFEETHTKNTYWIRNDILDALNKIATKRGEKTEAINQGLLLYFEHLQNRK